MLRRKKIDGVCKHAESIVYVKMVVGSYPRSLA